MHHSHLPRGPYELAFEAFGVRLAVSASNLDALDAIKQVLPPGWRQCDDDGAEPHYSLLEELAGTYTLSREGHAIHQGVELDLAVGLLDGQLRSEVSRRAVDWIFLHAGVVAHRGKAVLLPGYSFAGKTTLVAALVRIGATYYSDEFAPLDADGMVHPYPRGLSLRDNGRMARSDMAVESLGGVAGDVAIPVGMVAFTGYRRGGQWAPHPMTKAEGALALLPHTMNAYARPAESVHALGKALRSAEVIIRSDRGEADEAARRLIAELERLRPD